MTDGSSSPWRELCSGMVGMRPLPAFRRNSLRTVSLDRPLDGRLVESLP